MPRPAVDVTLGDRGEPKDSGRRGRRPDGEGRRQRGSPVIAWFARLVLVVMVIMIPIAGVLLVLDMVQVRSSLRTANASLEQVGIAMGDVEVVEAAEALEEAERELDVARSSSSGPVWSAASAVPVVRHSTELTRDIVETASVAVELSHIAVTDGAELVDGGLELSVSQGRLDLEPVLAARDLVDGLPVERLVRARDQLAVPRSGWVPGELREGRLAMLVVADDMVESVTRARAVTTALPGFLGSDGPRRYFVGMQTSSHLRGTGGLIGFWGVLELDGGDVHFGQSDVHDVFDGVDGPDGEAATGRISALGGPIDAGVETDAPFLARYGRLAGHSSFSQINLDPDVPTTARVGLDLYELRTGETLDGVILLDPDGVETLLTVTGSTLPLEADLAASLGLDGELETDRFAELVGADIYETLGAGRSAERKDALRVLGDAAFLQVFDGGWDGAAMARAVATASAGRHLQVYSKEEAEQLAFTDVGATGSLVAQDGIDLLAVTANNTGGGKQDVHLGHEFGVDIQLSDPRRAADGTISAERRSSIEVTVDNPLPSSGVDEYIIGNCTVEGATNRCFDGPAGWNWTWFSAWFPRGTQLVETRTDDGGPLDGVGEYRGLTVVDHYQGSPPQERGSFGFDVVGRAPLQVADERALVYELEWWRQAKGIPDLLDVRIEPPAGWSVADVEVVGGGDGRGAGVHGEGVKLRADTTGGGTATVQGTVSANTRIRVHLVGEPG